MEFHPTAGCCTANLIYNMDEVLASNHPKDQLKWLKSWANETTKPLKQDFALLYSITTDQQKNKAIALERLGFTKAFVGDKKHAKARQKNTGALTMWCISPPVLKENIEKLILTMDPEISAEEKVRRATLPEFKLLSVQRSELYIQNIGEKRLYRDDLFPMKMGSLRGQFLKLVTELTGGWDIAKDDFISINKNNLTWGMVKDRAAEWRAGNC